MLLFNARNSSRGFTLIEMLVIIAVVGILAAISAPSFLAWQNRTRVNNALTDVRGALQEAQREAMRKSKTCTVTLNTTNKKLTSPCLVTGDRTLPNGVVIATNISGSPAKAAFSYRGTILLSHTGKIILSTGDNTYKRCLVVSSPLGIMRTGSYSGSNSSSSEVTDGTCTTTP